MSVALCMCVATLSVALALGCDRAGPDASATTAPAAGAGADGAVHAAARRDAAHGFTGVFHRTGDGGARSVLNLTERDGKLTGMLDAANIVAVVDGSRATGEVRDPGTAMPLGTVELSLQEDRIVLALTATGATSAHPNDAPPLKLPPATFTRGAPPPIDVQLDARLTGRWQHAIGGGAVPATASMETVTAPSSEPPADVWLVLHPDGAVQYGRAGSAGAGMSAGADGGIATSGEDGFGFAGRWRTSDRMLHVVPAGNSRWVPFARYDVEKDKLTLTYHDGSRQVYYRQ